MNFGGSQQLRLFRRAIRDGATLEEACAATGGIIGPAEGRLHIAADEKNPPPPEAYELLYDPDARAAASQPEETTMASAAEKETGEGAGIEGEYKKPNAELAFKIYDLQIKPKKAKMAEIKGDLSQPHDDIKEQAHFPRKVLDFIVALEDLEDAKRDHFLLALSEGLKHRRLFLPRDLVTIAGGEDNGPVVPAGERPALKLATLPDDDFTEASEEELAAQEGRGGEAVEEEEPETAA